MAAELNEDERRRRRIERWELGARLFGLISTAVTPTVIGWALTSTFVGEWVGVGAAQRGAITFALAVQVFGIAVSRRQPHLRGGYGRWSAAFSSVRTRRWR